jgi:formylglycine-generating enzyme required for sulfatase activity
MTPRPGPLCSGLLMAGAVSSCAPPTTQIDAPPVAPPDLTPWPRVVRGGSWRSPAHQCRSASRKARDPDDAGKDMGFRVVRTRN